MFLRNDTEPGDRERAEISGFGEFTESVNSLWETVALTQIVISLFSGSFVYRRTLFFWIPAVEPAK